MRYFDRFFNPKRYFIEKAAVAILSGLLTPADFSQVTRTPDETVKTAIKYAEALYVQLYEPKNKK